MQDATFQFHRNTTFEHLFKVEPFALNEPAAFLLNCQWNNLPQRN